MIVTVVSLSCIYSLSHIQVFEHTSFEPDRFQIEFFIVHGARNRLCQKMQLIENRGQT